MFSPEHVFAQQALTSKIVLYLIDLDHSPMHVSICVHSPETPAGSSAVMRHVLLLELLLEIHFSAGRITGSKDLFRDVSSKANLSINRLLTCPIIFLVVSILYTSDN
jgi:hypothetical protein